MKIDIELVRRLTKLSKDSYEESKKIKEQNIQNKELKDIVTAVDIFMEKRIVESIKSWYPEHSIYGEEGSKSEKNSEYQWIVDPIDGTINFVAGLPLFTTSISLRKNNEVIFGFVCDYNYDKVYYAIKGDGAYCNEEAIHVSTRDQLDDCIASIIIGADYNEEYRDEALSIQKLMLDKARGIRIINSSAIELCWLASGYLDGFIKVKPSLGLGSMAGILMVKEAGGSVTNIENAERKDRDSMLITNGLVHEEIFNAIRK